MSGKRWEIPYHPVTLEDCAAGSRPPLLEAVLALRGIASEDAETFLHPAPGTLGDPMLLPDMPAAVARIRRAIENRETVLVYGDYDVDGITSLCLMTGYLRSRGVTCLAYIPDRVEEGYGVNRQAIDTFADKGVTLMITVDCGITAADEVEYAKSLGIDTVVTDHHECRGMNLPDAVAVVDPKRTDSSYGYDGFAGCGVAFKVLCALEGDAMEILRRYADLVAVGTVADVMPLVGENRFLVRAGLVKLARNPRPGLAALIEKSLSPGKELTASSISFSLAPRISAAGRLGETTFAVRLMMTEDWQEAQSLAQSLCDLNARRQAMEQEIWNDAVEMMKGQHPDAPIVLASDHWHKGIVGITASRLAEQFNVPSVMICLDGDEGKGSCRSYGNFDLFAALSACSEYLENFVGHALAAGLSIRKEDLKAFREALREYYLRRPPDESPDLRCELHIGDARLLTAECVEALELMEPYGNGNPKPLMCITGAVLDGIISIGGGKHLRLKLRRGGRVFDAVFFAHTTEELGLHTGDRVDVAFTPQINHYRDQRSVQLLVSDIRPTDDRPICRRILSGETPAPLEIAGLVPSRRELGAVWRKLERAEARQYTLDEIVRPIVPGIIPGKFCVCMRIFQEVALTRGRFEQEIYSVEVIPGHGKVNLEDSKLLRYLRHLETRRDTQ